MTLPHTPTEREKYQARKAIRGALILSMLAALAHPQPLISRQIPNRKREDPKTKKLKKLAKKSRKINRRK